jgi:hypothetical protein
VSQNAGYCISIYFKLPEMSDKRLMSARTKVRLNSPTSWRPYTSRHVLGLSATTTFSLMMKAVQLQDNGRQQQQQLSPGAVTMPCESVHAATHKAPVHIVWRICEVK